MENEDSDHAQSQEDTTTGSQDGDDLEEMFTSLTTSTNEEILLKYPSHRPYATQAFITEPQNYELDDPEVDFTLVPEQEKVLTRDLIFVLSGINTPLVSSYKISNVKVGFKVDDRLDPSLKDFARDIAQLAGSYHTTQKYIELSRSLESGKVNQALGAAMRPRIQEYRILVCQMETMFMNGELSLENLWFYMQKSVQQLDIMSSIATSIDDAGARGGQVLTILHNRAAAETGDELEKEMCLYFADSASQPYFRMLEKWLYKGVIHDPFKEFFVSDAKVEGNGVDEEEVVDTAEDYWAKRYSLNELLCPNFLADLTNEILKAGMYVNVILGIESDFEDFYEGSTISYNIHTNSYTENIHNSYTYASETVLMLLLHDYDLKGKIVSFKRFFLLDQVRFMVGKRYVLLRCDFIVPFLDLAKTELNEQISHVKENKVRIFMDLAIQVSTTTSDLYKDDVTVVFFPTGICDMLDDVNASGDSTELESNSEVLEKEKVYNIFGYESFCLKMDVKWPVSVVLNNRARTNYQFIFRHMFFCKHVERCLYDTWLEGKKNPFEHPEKLVAFALLNKMLTFVQNILYYMAFEVIEPAWHTFELKMEEVENVDQFQEAHSAFFSSIVHASLLNTSDLLEKISALLHCCLQYSKKFNQVASVGANEATSSTTSFVVNFDEEFSKNVVQFLRAVSTTVENPSPHQASTVINILHRMDYNGYYTEAIEED